MSPSAGLHGCRLCIPPHPRLRWSNLERQHDQGDTNHYHDEELGRPDLWCHISVAHSGKGYDAEIEGLEEGELLACSF